MIHNDTLIVSGTSWKCLLHQKQGSVTCVPLQYGDMFTPNTPSMIFAPILEATTCHCDSVWYGKRLVDLLSRRYINMLKILRISSFALKTCSVVHFRFLQDKLSLHISAFSALVVSSFPVSSSTDGRNTHGSAANVANATSFCEANCVAAGFRPRWQCVTAKTGEL